MPRRPRQHEVETESRVAFEAALGKRWLFRSPPNDYGIDGEVEEFDPGGLATGLIYSVQLKATDQEDVKKALRLSIPNEHADYYRSLQRPVLMVRYVAPSNALYARWFHQYDRYEDGGGAKSITFRWREEDVWDAGRDDEVGEEARAFIRLRSSQAAFPLRLYVVAGATGFDAAEFAAALQSRSRGVADLVVPAYSRPPAAANVLSITDDAMSVDLQHVTGAYLHFGNDATPADIPAETLAEDVLTLLGLALERIGQSSACARLAEHAFARSSIAGNADAAAALAGEMARGRHIYPAIQIYEELDSLELRDAAQAFRFAVSINAPTLSDAETDALRSAVERSIDRRREDDPGKAATDAFNLANMERSRGDYARATELLDLARALNPLYGERMQWWTQKGLIALEQGGFEDAAHDLREALRYGEDLLVVLQLAEALMQAGHYRAALDAIPALNDRELEEPWVAHLAVLACVLEVIADHLGIEDQERDPQAEADLDAEASRRLPAGKTLSADYLTGILRRDALCYLAWLLLYSKDTRGDQQEEFDRQLVLAWLTRTDARRWLDLIVDAINHGPVELVGVLFICGDEMTDRQLLAVAAHELGATDSGEIKGSELIDDIVAGAEARVLEARQRRDARFDVRFVDSGQTIHIPNSLAEPPA